MQTPGRYDLSWPTTVSAGGISGHELRWKRFDEAKNAWVEADPAEKLPVEESFKLISFNVWFSTHRQRTRLRALQQTIEEEQPDFVCLQEATVRFLNPFLEGAYIRKNFWISSTVDEFDSLNADVGYDSFMLCSPQYAGELYRYRLTSKYGRKVYINLAPQGFGVATIHLESMKDESQNRARQMREIYDLLDEHQVLRKSFFCGDLNHCMSLGENHLRMGVSQDVWLMLHPDEVGWTEDAEVNLMLAKKPGQHPKVRFDRIVVNGDVGLDPVDIRILGTNAIDEMVEDDTVDRSLKDVAVFISDHFGLVAKFEKK